MIDKEKREPIDGDRERTRATNDANKKGRKKYKVMCLDRVGVRIVF
jgi:hypothetical protein